jgi:glycerol-3-phosphate dehydrogenase
MPIMIPIQQWWKAPYMWAGTKAYDLLSGFAKSSYCMGKSATLTAFPNLDNKNLLGSLVYYGKLFSAKLPGKSLE